ncbi:MAG: hypothetical protein ACMUIU_00640 [bacterium]
MSKKISSSHALINMFKRATKRAFRCYPELYDKDVSDHICSHILTEFVRTDRLFWIKDKKGSHIIEVPEMCLEGDVMCRAKSLEKEMAVQEYIGNFSLFMAGLFPTMAPGTKGRLNSKNRMKDRLYMELYFKLHPAKKGMDYYVIQGERAYEKASRIYKGLNDIKSSLLKKLALRFEAYVCLMQTIHDYLLSPSLNLCDIQ